MHHFSSGLRNVVPQDEERRARGGGAPRPPGGNRCCARELGAKETEEQGLAGFRAPILRRPRGKKPAGLGAKGTEEQGLAGFRAPSPYRPQAKSRRRLWKKKPVPAAEGLLPPAPAEVYKLPYDNKSVLKGNFFCGIILSPERGQRCDTGNNMKGDAI